jgi:DNA-binding NtrC family response regulator
MLAPTKVPEPSEFMNERALGLRALSVERWGENRAIELLGFASSFVELQTKLAKAARYKEPVLITGESGVGKELLAQAVYLLGSAQGAPYVSVNCPQHQDANLTVSELFGHTKGSFTGAIADHRGAFEEAHKGVIFLDEVGDLDLTAQALLLRTLQTGEFKPLGATRSRTADVRVVAATNRSLNALVLTKQFRYDLLFRLWYFHLAVPPLRERGEDWQIILEHRLRKLAQQYGVAKKFSSESLKLLREYHWPGNVRQLISVVTMGYAMADGQMIEPHDFAAEIDKPQEPITLEQIGPQQQSVEMDLSIRLQVGVDFWREVYQPFMERDLNRGQVKRLVRTALSESGGNYRRLLELLRLPPSDYQRFMDFLRHHNLKP